MRAMNSSPGPVVAEHMPPARRSLRIAVVTETYPPEVNGVALSLHRVVEGLRALEHDIQLVRPRQAEGDLARRIDRLDEILVRGVPIPRYPEMKMGMPANKALGRSVHCHGVERLGDPPRPPPLECEIGASIDDAVKIMALEGGKARIE